MKTKRLSPHKSCSRSAGCGKRTLFRVMDRVGDSVGDFDDRCAMWRSIAKSQLR